MNLRKDHYHKAEGWHNCRGHCLSASVLSLSQDLQDQWLWKRMLICISCNRERNRAQAQAFLPCFNHNTKNKITTLTLRKEGVGMKHLNRWFISPSHMTQMPYDFQQRMSWFPQRWRTQRNAIRNANCISSWIIKSLNAHCASGICPEACLFECPQTPLNQFFIVCSLKLLCWTLGLENT